MRLVNEFLNINDLYLRLHCASLINVFQELGKIIQKDFFPDLEKLKAQNAYLDAVERSDFDKIRELQTKFCGRTPSIRERSNRGRFFFVTYMVIVHTISQSDEIYSISIQMKPQQPLKRQ